MVDRFEVRQALLLHPVLAQYRDELTNLTWHAFCYCSETNLPVEISRKKKGTLHCKMFVMVHSELNKKVLTCFEIRIKGTALDTICQVFLLFKNLQQASYNDYSSHCYEME